MILKVFEDKVIPNEIHVYFDDLAGQYLKKTMNMVLELIQSK